MTETEKLIEIYKQLEDAGLMVTAGKKDAAELMVSHDVVPVVRCKNCKHYEKTTLGNGDRCMCTKFLGLTIPKPDDFCSYGERRTDVRIAD